MNKPVSFELAKLLKEKGFNKRGYLQDVWLGNRYEGKHPKVKEIPVFGLGSTSVLPTISDVVMWLWEKHQYSIEHSMDIPQSGEQDGCYVFNGIVKGSENYKAVLLFSSENLSSIEKAYEAAIEYALKNLI